MNHYIPPEPRWFVFFFHFFRNRTAPFAITLYVSGSKFMTSAVKAPNRPDWIGLQNHSNHHTTNRPRTNPGFPRESLKSIVELGPNCREKENIDNFIIIIFSVSLSQIQGDAYVSVDMGSCHNLPPSLPAT
jgi:hypothetical protein